MDCAHCCASSSYASPCLPPKRPTHVRARLGLAAGVHACSVGGLTLKSYAYDAVSEALSYSCACPQLNERAHPPSILSSCLLTWLTTTTCHRHAVCFALDNAHDLLRRCAHSWSYHDSRASERASSRRSAARGAYFHGAHRNSHACAPMAWHGMRRAQQARAPARTMGMKRGSQTQSGLLTMCDRQTWHEPTPALSFFG